MLDSDPSLRAKRSNPENLGAPRSLDCFVATLLAMTTTVQPNGVMLPAQKKEEALEC